MKVEGRSSTAQAAPELDSVARSLAEIGESLASSYQALERRAERVEAELSRANTELLELNGRLHAQEKLAALGNMAGGIAHELRNPMNAVKGFAALLLGRLAPDTKERHFAARIVEGVSEADAILSSMLTLARAEPLVREPVDGRELVDSAIHAAIEGRPESERARWRIATSFLPDPVPAFVADRLKLRQALRNLIANAVEAQPAGGTIGISLERAGSDLVLRVADAGPGIAPELRRRILEPFFTTRAEGTGLGLALVNTIAQLHSGRVEVATDPSPLGGADISIHIPFHSPR